MDANVAIGIGIALGFASGGAGIGQGIAVNGAMNGMARQPDLSKFISNQMLIGLIFPEFTAIMAFVGALMLMGKVSTPTNAPPPAASSMAQPAHSVPGTAVNTKSVALRDGSTAHITLPR